tara:strand:- start:137 stop:1159 length:1023 start_codon:yes stop_codon:yes gene_type:complete
MALTLHGTVSDNTVALDRKTATPIIINGDMQIAQRATSGTYTGTEDEIETCDRWKGFIGSAGTFTNTQDTDVPTGYGFAKSWKLDCTTADSSLSSTDFFFVRQKIEGQNLQVFKKGTSNAEAFTLAFWVKSHVTGTFTCELEDHDNSRSASKSYTVSSANTWEKKVISFPADTSGAFGNDNGASLSVKFWLAAGTGFSSGTLQETWDTTTTAEQVASGQVNLASSTDNNWWFTGVQLEVGTFADTNSIPDFQFEDVGTNLARCQRYFTKTLGAYESSSGGSGSKRIHWQFKQTMRATPTIVEAGTTKSGVQLLNADTYGINRSGDNTAVLGSGTTAEAEL